VGILGYARIAELLTGLLLDRPLAERMGAQGHEFALESFGTESVVGRWVEVYERCKPRSQSAGVA